MHKEPFLLENGWNFLPVDTVCSFKQFMLLKKTIKTVWSNTNKVVFNTNIQFPVFVLGKW